MNDDTKRPEAEHYDEVLKGFGEPTFEEQLLQEINNYREEGDDFLPPLSYDPMS